MASKALTDLSIGMAKDYYAPNDPPRLLDTFNPGPSGMGATDFSSFNQGLQTELDSAADQTKGILQTYNERRRLAEGQGADEQKLIASRFNEAIQDQVSGSARQLEGTVEAQSGFAQHSLLFRNLAKDTREAVRDLTAQKEQALSLGRIEAATRLDKLILDQETALSAARTRYTDLLFKTSEEIRNQAQEGRNQMAERRAQSAEERARLSFETPEQQRAAEFEAKVQESVMGIMTSAPDAGILATDDYNTAIAKYRNSDTYKRDVRRGEQDIELMRANIAKAWADKAQTDAQTEKIRLEAAAITADTGDPEQDKMLDYQLNIANRAIQGVDKAIEIFNDMQNGIPTTPKWRAFNQFIPGNEAKNLAEAVKKIKANIGFNELQAMRAASPTGGALGQVAVQELEMLQAVLGSLDITQDNEYLSQNLNAIRTHYNNWKAAVMESKGGVRTLSDQPTVNQGLDSLESQFLNRNTQTSTPSGT